jgi:hypothetical protein
MATEPGGHALLSSVSGGLVEIQDLQSVETTMVRQAAQTRLVVLSCDDHVIDVVRNAAQSVARVACARDLQQLLHSFPDIEPDVLIADGSKLDIAATIDQLARHFPDVVTIIVGTRDQSSGLLQLAAAGQIFRFLLRPLSSGPVRLVLAAAIARRGERKEADHGSVAMPVNNKRPRKRLAVFGALAVALFTMIGGLWAGTTLLTPKKVTPPTVALVQVAKPKPDSLQTQLALAADAMAQGQSINPGGALDLYRNILALDSGNAAALAGVRSIADQQLEGAEAALVAENLDAAQQAIALVRDIDVNHPRLAFLDTQLARERERRNLRVQRVRRLVESANVDMQSGNLLGLVSGGAVDALLEARKLDPDDPGVARGIDDLATALADALRKASSTGDTLRVQAYATAARRLGVGSQVLGAAGLPRDAFPLKPGAAQMRPGPSALEQAASEQAPTIDSESN